EQSSSQLDLRAPRRPWAGDHIPDAAHAGHEGHEALQPQAEARVRYGTEAACVQEPPELFLGHAHLVHPLLQHIQSFLALAAADDLADAGEEYVHRGHGVTLVGVAEIARAVQAHIEGRDLRRAPLDDHRLLEALLDRIALV